MSDRIKNLVEPLAKSLGCEAEIKYVPGYTIVKNDPELFEIGKKALTEQLGEENIIFPENPASGAEDFSAFGKKVPVFFYWLGMESEKNVGQRTLHNPKLNVDEDCIPVGIQGFVSYALEFLKDN